MKKLLTILFAIALILTLTGMVVLNLARFGQSPKGERLEWIKKSANYKDGEFKNLSETPTFTSDKSRFQVMKDFIFRKKFRVTPEGSMPVIKTDIKALNSDDDVLVWFGHSSYFIRLKGKTFLVDPVFSPYASPFSFINKAFKGTAVYKAKDLPDIDYLIITHDHWDHLDYQTVFDLKPNVKHVVTGLGVGQHFEFWGFDPKRITELDWYEGLDLGTGWHLTATPARHFSGRGLKRNKTLWASFVLTAPDFNLFIGGDGGYDVHFSDIGSKYGPFDLAIMEQGQYDENWNLIHLLPEQVFKAAQQLSAYRILPVHNSKFALANHPWDEPLNKITENQQSNGIPVLTPRIGEPVFLNDTTQVIEAWWKRLD